MPCIGMGCVGSWIVAGMREATDACGTGWVGKAAVGREATPGVDAAADVDNFGIFDGGTGWVGSTTEGGLGCVGSAGIISGCVGSAGVMGGGRLGACCCCCVCWKGSFRFDGDSIIE